MSTEQRVMQYSLLINNFMSRIYMMFTRCQQPITNHNILESDIPPEKTSNVFSVDTFDESFRTSSTRLRQRQLKIICTLCRSHAGFSPRFVNIRTSQWDSLDSHSLMSVTTEIADIVYGAKFGLNFIFRTRNFSTIGKNKNGKIDFYFFFQF